MKSLFLSPSAATLAEGSPHHCRHTLTPSHITMRAAKWSVDASRQADGTGEGDHHHHQRSVTPLLPRMVELDILKHRHTETLLGQFKFMMGQFHTLCFVSA